jgi:adenosylcobinamide kinase / adenosylcobinamide-phosphate guanylyltransferase
MLTELTLVIGGAASGKSRIAEELVLNSGLRPVYLATARIWDDEVNSKVKQHVARRGPEWTTLDAPVDVAGPLGAATADQALLLDCATMWLTNLLMDEADVATEQLGLLDALTNCAAPVVVVTNEVGQGIVPNNALSRSFREAQGRLNIALAERAGCVVHVVAGLTHVLKGEAP